VGLEDLSSDRESDVTECPFILEYPEVRAEGTLGNTGVVVHRASGVVGVGHHTYLQGERKGGGEGGMCMCVCVLRLF
jgi:hypothetical protein